MTTLTDLHNQIALSRMQPGDLIEFKRPNYSHWGVCVYDHKIVHLTADGKSFSPSGNSTTAEVRKDDFSVVTGDCKAYVNNATDQNWTPLPVVEIVERAEQEIGKSYYNFLSNNCEHFAHWCRYNKRWSRQIFRAVLAVPVAAAGAVIAGVPGVLVAGGLYIKSMFNNTQ